MSTAGQEGHGQHLAGSNVDPKPTLDQYSDLPSTAPNSQASSNDSSHSQTSRSQVSSKGTSEGHSVIGSRSSDSLDKSRTLSGEGVPVQDVSACSTNHSITTSNHQGQSGNIETRLPNLNGSSLNGSNDANNRFHGQKRTASGNIKSPSLTSPVSPYRKSHSRQTSTASNGSQVGELSAQLRARLSYAMVKVQNGWESRTIDEVETLASKQTSPVSASSPLQRTYQAPYADLMDLYREKSGFQQSSERTTAALSQPLTATHLPSISLSQSRDHPHGTKVTYPTDGDSDSRVHQACAHESGKRRSNPQLQTGAQVPSLAPPLELGSRHHRRPNQCRVQPPRLDTHNASNLSTSSGRSASSTIPATPPSKRTPVMNSSSQKAAAIEKAAMEKDAIETLLFMSSPRNPQYHPSNSQLPNTPLRNHFLAAERHVDFAVDQNLAPSPQKQRALLDTAKLSNEANIDKVLDQMSDDESSSDEDEILISPRHGILG